MYIRKIFLLSLLFAMICTGVWASEAHQDQRQLADKLIRLHVLANSDSEEDQALKLQVRDSILHRAEEILRGAEDLKAAKGDLEAALPELEALAEAAVQAAGYAYPVAASLTWESYPTRVYDTFALPAGEYLSLRLIIGEGKGHNWWCVVYPPLCQSVSQEDFTGAAEEAGLTEEEVSLISGESRGYAVRFKSMEWVENLLASFS